MGRVGGRGARGARAGVEPFPGASPFFPNLPHLPTRPGDGSLSLDGTSPPSPDHHALREKKKKKKNRSGPCVGPSRAPGKSTHPPALGCRAFYDPAPSGAVLLERQRNLRKHRPRRACGSRNRPGPRS